LANAALCGLVGESVSQTVRKACFDGEDRLLAHHRSDGDRVRHRFSASSLDCVSLGRDTQRREARPSRRLLRILWRCPGCPPGHVPSQLRRPFHLPTRPSQARCPVSAPGKQVSPDFGPAIGDGPLYAISLFSLARTGTLPFDYPPRPGGLFAGSAWGGQVLKWLGDPSYDGPVLIRGRRLRDRYRLGFGSGIFFAYSEMQLPPRSGRPASWWMARLAGICPIASARLLRGAGRRNQLQRGNRLRRRSQPPRQLGTTRTSVDVRPTTFGGHSRTLSPRRASSFRLRGGDSRWAAIA
jgi:hypothetical protein